MLAGEGNSALTVESNVRAGPLSWAFNTGVAPSRICVVAELATLLAQSVLSFLCTFTLTSLSKRHARLPEMIQS